MDRKNADIYFLFRFVTDYGKDNLQFSIKMNNRHLVHVPMFIRTLIKMDRKNADIYFLFRFVTDCKNAIVLFFIRVVTDYGKDNLQFSIKMYNRHLVYIPMLTRNHL